MRSYQAISADAHLETSPDAWTPRVPAELRHLAPRVVELDDGGQGWAIGDGHPVALGLQVTGGQRYRDIVARGRRYEEGLPGTGDASQRLREQDEDGVDAEVLFSSVIAAALRRYEDRAVLNALTVAYNDWLSDYCSENPERLLGVALVPPTNAADAAREAERVASMPGIRGVQLLTFPSGLDWGTYADEPFWKTVQDTGIAVVCHHNFGGEDAGSKTPQVGTEGEEVLHLDGGTDLASFAWLLTCDLPLPTLPIFTIEQLFLGGVLDRYPALRFHFAETGIGWLGYWLEQMDDRYERHRHWANVELRRRPSAYIRDHFTFSFQEDHCGVALRHHIGIDNICWASDFPHTVSDWPWSVETRERQLAGLPDDERLRIEALNIATHLRLMTPEDKERLARQPRKPTGIDTVPARGDRRA
jgi:predicted TIM-barrel fold metal-dependent hydrolase